jgi:2-keto-4-pentenoate hydratase/2-oxohepta-3-ene-1,7-dioic acid hydratase in catechol pathway
LRIAVFDDYRVGLVDEGAVRDVSHAVPEPWRGTPYAVNELIEAFDDLRERLPALAASSPPLPLAGVRLHPPLPRPRQLLAAPLNYHQHITEMSVSAHVPSGLSTQQTARELGFFIKASGSICGPADAIELPRWEGRTFHHEAELAVVIGRTARAVPRERALDHVFGYTCLVDVTMRMSEGFEEERPMRKSFHTFTPIGPHIVSSDHVADVQALAMKLWVNGELRQEASTATMIVGVAELIERASAVVTLHPGDVYATGTPEGVGPIEPGDTVRIWIDQVGEMSVPVRLRSW